MANQQPPKEKKSVGPGHYSLTLFQSLYSTLKSVIKKLNTVVINLSLLDNIKENSFQ